MKVTQEPDRVNQKAVLIVAAAAAAVTVIGVLIAWGLLEWNVASLPMRSAPVSARDFSAPEEVNATEMTLFKSLDGRRRTLEAPERLQSYGFVDREAGRIHIPIRRAMQLYIEQQNGTRDPHPPHRPPARGGQP